MSELKNALRAGDVWVPGSRQFRDFDEYFDRARCLHRKSLPAMTSLLSSMSS